jgi:hypothetical protein
VAASAKGLNQQKRRERQRTESDPSSENLGGKRIDKHSVRVLFNLHTMSETPEDVRRWFLTAIEKLWPVALGSISLRKSPCIRENCSACASGEGHSSYALSGYQGNRRVSVYVPDSLAPEIQGAVERGRRLQDLIKEAGVRYIRARKRVKRSTRRK